MSAPADVLAVMEHATHLLYLDRGQTESAPVAEARAAVARMVDALDFIATRYDDSKPTSECAMDAYDMSCVARAALANIGGAA